MVFARAVSLALSSFVSIWTDSVECRKSGVGCYIGNRFASVFGYADDLLLACPSRGGLQKRLDIASSYDFNHKIAFSADANPSKSKTKCMVLSKKPQKSEPAPLKLDNRNLPWVHSAKYLGFQVDFPP